MNKHVAYLCKLFVDGNIDRVIEEYHSQGGYYVGEDYIDIWNMLYKAKGHFLQNSRCQFMWELFDKTMEVCSKNIQDIQNRERLISTLHNFLMSVKNKCYQKNYNRKNADRNRNAALKLLLNIVCAFSDSEYKIQYLALIYDMVQRLNDIDSSFYEFYGEDAEIYIITNASNILRRANIKKQYIISKSEKEDRNYIRNFCENILKYWNEEEKRKEKNSVESGSLDAPAAVPASAATSMSKSKSVRVRDVVFILFLLFLACMFYYGSYSGFIGNKNSNEKVIEAMKKELNELTNRIEELNGELENQAAQFKAEKAEVDEKLQKAENELEDLRQKQQAAGIGIQDEGAAQEQTNSNYKMPVESKIWSEKSEASVAIGMVEEGRNVTVLEEQDDEGWMKISYKNIQGYVKI